MHQELKNTIEHALSNSLGEDIIITNSSVLGGGCINNASKMSTNKGDFFVKWNASGAPDMFLREEEGLLELKKASKDILQVPSVYVAGEISSMPGYLVMDYLPPGNSELNSDEKLGHGLATIHKHHGESHGFYNNNYCGSTPQNNSWNNSWLNFFREQRLQFLLNLIQKSSPLGTSEIKVYTKLLDRLPKLINEQASPSLIHGDLWSGNYMFTKNGPALIDPAAYYADREMEFAIMTMFGGFSSRFYSAYNEIYPLEPDWKNRNKLYQLYHILNHYYLFGGSYGSQALYVAKSYL